jgi:hypothetical protein
MLRRIEVAMTLLPKGIPPAVCLLLLLAPPTRGEQARGGSVLPDGALVAMDPARARAGGPVFAVAFSPDGKWLVSGSRDGLVRLWNAATGSEVRCFKGHQGPVKAVAFAGDGQALASAGNDQTVRLWDVATGKPLGLRQGHRGPVEAVAFAPRGKLLASGGKDGTVYLVRADADKEVQRLRGHYGPVHTLAFSPDGRVLASGGRDRTIRFWDVATGKELRRVRGPGWVFSVAFSADGSMAASGGQDQMIHLWDVAGAESLDLFGGYEGPVQSVAVTADGKMVAAGSQDHKVRLWESATGKVRRLFEGHRGAVWSVALSPDGQRLASAGQDGALWIWDMTGQFKDGRRLPADLPRRDHATLWGSLGSSDAAVAYQAMGRLTAAPGPAVPLLAKRLQFILDLQPRVARLLADLDSRKFAVRHRAQQELERLGELILPNLNQALQGKPTYETRLRVEQLLRKVKRSDEELGYSARWQLLRVIEVLEHIGTAPARRLLERLAGGLPTTWGKRAARASLERLGRRPATRP